MLDTFKARLKAKTTATGVNLSQKRIDAIADRLHKKFPELVEEADHDKHLDELNELTPFDEMAKTDDRLRTLENKKTEKPKDEPKPTDTPKADDDTPAWAKTLIESNQKLSADLAAIQKEKNQQSISTKVSSHEKLKDVPADFLALSTLPEKEEEIDAFVDKVVTTWGNVKQKMADDGFAQTTKPVNGQAAGGKDKVSSEMSAFLSAKKEKETVK